MIALTTSEARAILLILDTLSASPRGPNGRFLTDRQLDQLEAAQNKLERARRSAHWRRQMAARVKAAREAGR